MKKLIIGGLSSLTLLFGTNSAISTASILEDNATVYDVEQLKLNMQHLIAFKRVNETTLEITNWVPRDLHNLVVVAKNLPEEKIVEIDILPGFSKQTYIIPYLGENATFDYLPQTDVQRKIKGLKTTWNITFPDRLLLEKKVRRADANVVWKPTRPQDVRYYLSFLINAAQSISTPKFHNFWKKTAFYDETCNIEPQYRLTKDEFNNYSKKERRQYKNIRRNCYYNKTHKEYIYNKLLHKTFTVGVTDGGGLGGGSTLGLNQSEVVEHLWDANPLGIKILERGDWFIKKANRKKVESRTPWKIFGHEAGHTLVKKGHKRNYCVNSENSFVSVGFLVYNYLTYKNEMIVTKETMVKRDLDWEGANSKPLRKYKRALKRGANKKRINALIQKLHRPTARFAYEWGGVYGKHALLLPTKNSPEWYEYLKAHKEGKGLEYLRTLQ